MRSHRMPSKDRGDGKFAVWLYNNNHPGLERTLLIDHDAETWSYNGAETQA